MKLKLLKKKVCGRNLYYPLDESTKKLFEAFPNMARKRICLTEWQIVDLQKIGWTMDIRCE